jgi:hypothetical protein
MKSYEETAVNFVQALADDRWEDARTMLDAELQNQLPVQKLVSTFEGMYKGYAEGPVTSVQFDPEFSMENWPAKKPEDVGWVYVSVQGNGFVEAVTVVVTNSSGHLAIRYIEWGRP